MTDITVFNDKAYVSFTDYKKLEEELEKENRKLKNDIEKMKNCHNCKNGIFTPKGNFCEKHCKRYDKWEIDE